MDQIKKYGKQSTIFLVVATTLLLVTVVGTLGSSVTLRMPYPFFNAVKLITFIESFDKLESLILAVWVASDFVLIAFLAIVIMNIIKNLFALSKIKYLATPVLSIGYIGAQYLAKNIFELEVFSTGFAMYTNLVLFYVIPFITLIIGKIRKKL